MKREAQCDNCGRVKVLRGDEMPLGWSIQQPDPAGPLYFELWCHTCTSYLLVALRAMRRDRVGVTQGRMPAIAPCAPDEMARGPERV